MSRYCPSKSVFCFLIVFSFLADSGANSEERSLGEVTVHVPSEEKEETHDSVSFSAVITSQEFQGRRTNLSEALQEKAGVEIRRYGGLDDFATVSIRGSTSEQVAVYLDGILLNQGIGGGVNLATIPVDQIERVEVYKGSAPASFGSSAIGGVVAITTKKKKIGRETKVTQSFGSFKTYEGTIVHSQRSASPSAHHSYQLGYTFSRSSGDFSYRDNNGTPFNDSDDRVTERRNNAFDRHNLSTGLERKFVSWNDLSLGLQNRFFLEDRGVPGLATLTSDAAHLRTIRNGTALELTRDKILTKLSVTLRPWFQFLNVAFRDPKGEIGLGIKDTHDDTFQYGSTLKGGLVVGTHQKWNLVLEYRGERFLQRVRNGAAFSLEDEIVLAGERVIINPSIRSEHVVHNLTLSSSTLHPVSGKVGIKYLPFKKQRWFSLKGNFSRSYRIPNFTELFGDQGSLVGNPALSPESGFNGDAGILLDFTHSPDLKGPRLEISWFLNEINDLIQFLQTSQFNVQARNLAAARIQGVESSFNMAISNHLHLGGSYTFQWARDTSGLPGLEGKFLPGRPIHEASGRFSLHNRHGKVFTELNFLDSNFLDTQNILRVDHRVMVGAGGSIQFLKRFTAGLEAKNLLNDLVADVVGFPLPGRSFYGKLEIAI